MAKDNGKLEEFRKKRDFRKTPEPHGNTAAEPGEGQPEGPVFVIQKHDATTLHYDFRLEVGGVLASWAVPKGPPEAAGDRRLAIKVEDHPLDYGPFEGVIPEGEYGGGTVMLWDIGTYENLRQDKPEDAGRASMEQSIEAGLVEVRLHGQRLKGEIALKRFKEENGKEQWLMLRMKGEGNEQPGLKKANTRSVRSGRSMKGIASGG